MSRKADLEHSIRQSYQLIREYESIARTSSDPKERTRCQREIEEQWSHIRGYLDEYLPLAGVKLPEDIAEIAAHVIHPPTLRPTASLGTPLPPDQMDISESRATQTSSRGVAKRVISWLKTLPVEAQVTLIVGILGLIVACAGWVIAPAVENWIQNRQPTPTSAVPGTSVKGYFHYYVRVKVENRAEHVENAKVSIEIAGRAPLNEKTDSTGLALFQIPSSHADQPGRLIVDKPGYERYEEMVTLTTDTLPHMVDIRPVP